MSGTDYYRILGVPPSATGRAIREAYLDLARRLHPDRVGPEGTALFQKVTEAYENLSDPDKRRAYDRLCTPVETGRTRRSERFDIASDVEPLTPEPTPTHHQRESGSPSEVIDLEVILTRREAELGAVLPVVVPSLERCPWCGGTGRSWYPCEACRGSGVAARRSLLRVGIPPRIPDGSVIEAEVGAGALGRAVLRLHVRVHDPTVWW